MDQRALFRVEIVHQWLEKRGFHVRDRGLLSLALERPWLTFGDEELYPTVWLKAAALMDSIQSSHPLYDGNKRVGVLLAGHLLHSSGVNDRLIADDDWFDQTIAVANGEMEISEIADRLEKMCSDAGGTRR